MTNSWCALFLRAFACTSRSRCGSLRTEEEQPLSILAAGEAECEPTAETRAGKKAASAPRELLNRLASTRWRQSGLAFAAVMLTWIAYDTTAEMIGIAAARDSAAR